MSSKDNLPFTTPVAEVPGTTLDFGYSETAPTDPGLSFGYGDTATTSVVPPNAEDAERRANKWHYGLGNESPGLDVLLARIRRGEEKDEEAIQREIAKTNDEIFKEKAVRRMLEEPGITPERVQMVRDIALTTLPEKEAFFAESYAKRLVEDSMATYVKPLTERDYVNMDGAQKMIMIKEAVQKQLEDMKARAGNLNPSEKVFNVLGQFVPLLQGARLRNSFAGLTGNDLTEQHDRVFLNPNPNEGIKEIVAKSEDLFNKNALTAIEYLESFLAYSSGEAALANFFTAVDFATAPGVGLAFKGVKNAVTTGNIMGNIARVNNGARAVEITDLLAAAGKTREAGMFQAAADLQKKAANQGITPVNNFSELMAQTYTLTNAVGNVTRGARADVVEVAQRIKRNLEYGKAAYEDNLNSQIKTRRIDADTQAKRIADAETDRMFRVEYPHLEDRIMNVFSSNLEDVVTSNWYRVYEFGQDVSQRGSKPSLTKGFKADEAITPSGKLNETDRTPFKGMVSANDNLEGVSQTTKTGDVKKGYQFDLKATNDNIKVEMGRYDLRPFETDQAAHRAAKEDYKLKNYEVVPKGDGFVIQVRKAVDETLPSVRNALIEETGNQNPQSWASQFFSFISRNSATLRGMTSKGTRFDDATMREAQLASFQVAPSAKLMETLAEPVIALRSGAAKEWEDFKTLLSRQRVQYNRDTGQLGVFSRDMGELDAAYQAQFGRVATAAEHAAYWSYRQINDIDYVTRNLQLVTRKAAQGRQTISIDDLSFEGKTLDHLPFDSQVNAGFVIWDKNPENLRFGTLHRISDADREAIMARVASGELKVVQVAPDSYRSIMSSPAYRQALGNNHFSYVLTDNLQTGPLPFKQVPYREGGHHVNEYSHFLRQAELRNLEPRGERTAVLYTGDVNIHGFMSEREGNLFASRFNTAREMLRNGDEAGLRAYLNQNLPYSFDTFRQFFREHGGRLSLDEPVRLTPSGTNVDKAHKLEDIIKAQRPNERFIRASDNPHNLDAQDGYIQFMSERGQPISGVTIEGGTTQTPLFRVEQQRLMDPMAVVMRSTQDVLESRGFDDLRARLATTFVEQFHSILDWDLTKLRTNPMQSLLEAPVKQSADPAELAALKDFRRGAKEMLYIKSDNQAKIDALHQRLVEGILGRVPDKNSWAGWSLSLIKDPFSAMRAAAFDLKQGMFSPTAFINQALAVNHVASIEGPVVALRAGLAANVARSVANLDQSPKVLQHAAKLSGMEPKHFLEMWEAMGRSGFNMVGREVADRGDWLTPAMGEGKFAAFLDYGRYFFKQGELVGRYTAYGAAYSKWRAANPNAVFDDLAKATVLQRANFLNLEMTGINNSSMQKGLPGVITQFYTAHFRQAEQMLGSRLTPTEKARWIAWNSFMFGIPAAAGGAIGVWPMANTAREAVNESGWINEKGWHPNDSVLMNTMINGAISAATNEAGSQFNTSNLFLGGANLFRDLIHGKKEVVEFMGGVSGKAMSDLLKTSQPLLWSLLSLGQDDKYELTVEDFRTFMGNVSSLSNAERLHNAVVLNKYFSKDRSRAADVTALEGLVMSLTGAQPQRITDAYDMQTSIHADKERKKEIEKEYAKSVRYALEAQEKNDLEGFGHHMKNAQFHYLRGNFRPDERMLMLQRAMKDNESMVDRARRAFSKQMNTPGHIDAFLRQVERNSK